MSKKVVTLRLSIEITYKTNGVPVKELEQRLTVAANNLLADETALTGDGPSEIASYSTNVDAVFSSAPDRK